MYGLSSVMRYAREQRESREHGRDRTETETRTETRTQTTAKTRRRADLDGNVVAALGSDDPVPVVVVHDVVVDRQVVRVVVGVEAVAAIKKDTTARANENVSRTRKEVVQGQDGIGGGGQGGERRRHEDIETGRPIVSLSLANEML